MSSFAGSMTALFVAGMVGGYAGLCLLGPTDETQTAVAAARIPDPPPVPCGMQAWPNADRKCLSWTAPQPVVAEAKTDGAPKVGPAAPAPGKRAGPAAQPSTVGMSVANRQAPAAAVPQAVTMPQLAAVPQPAVEAAPEVAAAPEPQAEPAAPTKTAKSQAHAKTKALAVVRGFGDNLNDVPLNAYASDGAPRRSAARASAAQDRYNARPKGWWW
jgi:hypothetical protein